MARWPRRGRRGDGRLTKQIVVDESRNRLYWHTGLDIYMLNLTNNNSYALSRNEFIVAAIAVHKESGDIFASREDQLEIYRMNLNDSKVIFKGPAIQGGAIGINQDAGQLYWSYKPNFQDTTIASAQISSLQEVSEMVTLSHSNSVHFLAVP